MTTKRLHNEMPAMMDLIQQILETCPVRPPASAQEHQAQILLMEAFERLGLKTEMKPFRFNRSLYANLAVHFGVGLAGSALSGRRPVLSALLSTLAAGSYLADSTRKAYLLRRLLPWRPSHNLLATLPAKGRPALRIVVIGHADAAYTGLLFHPQAIKRFTSHAMPDSMKWMGRSLAVATWSQFGSAATALLRGALGAPGRFLWPVSLALAVPAAIALATNLEIVLRNHTVPGANDNLTGAVATVELARRFAPKKPDDLELVFVVTGCEEAGTGGAMALAKAMHREWEPFRTVIIALDSLSNGQLRVFGEGEVLSVPTPEWLLELVDQVAASDPGFGRVEPFQIPSGATDVLPFRARGYDGLSLGCVDPEFGSPAHYHHPSDNLENLDPEQLERSVDFTERLIEAIAHERLKSA